MSGTDKTIAAVSTPYGRGGIAVIRVSGREAVPVVERCFFPQHKNVALKDMEGYRALYGVIKDKGEKIDDAVALFFRAPHSYTGEDTVELSVHGGIYLAQRVLTLLYRCGASPAEPGEFTKRAFLSGKMSLDQAEAVMDLITAQSEQAVKMAVGASEGSLAKRIRQVSQSLVTLSGYLGAWFDFPEEDIEQLDSERLLVTITNALDNMNSLIDGYEKGRIIKEGISAVIVGRPNVGKSTLMNSLVGEERSIVTDVPGTTRDVVEETVIIGGYVLRLADTAGIRSTEDQVERIGVALAHKRIESAQLILAVFDNSSPLMEDDLLLLEKIKGTPSIGVINKTDLPTAWGDEDERIKDTCRQVVYVSAKAGGGEKAIEQAIRNVLELNEFDASAPILANERQLYCVIGAKAHLEEARDAFQQGMTLDAVSVLIEDSLDSLLQITGERATDLTVNNIFENFCVGK